MKGIIITSEIDNNYFIINDGVYFLNELYLLLMKNNERELAKQILEFNKIKESFKLFVDKKSDLGVVLEKFIKEKKLLDDNDFIEPRHLINALISDITCDVDSVKETVSEMIKHNYIGTIDELSKYFPKETLRRINLLARLTWRSKNSEGRKYLKEINLTGYEENGLIYENGSFYNINIFDKINTEIGQNKKKVLNNQQNRGTKI